MRFRKLRNHAAGKHVRIVLHTHFCHDSAARDGQTWPGLSTSSRPRQRKQIPTCSVSSPLPTAIVCMLCQLYSCTGPHALEGEVLLL